MKIIRSKGLLGKLLVPALFFVLFVKLVASVSAVTVYPSFTDISGKRGENFKKALTILNDSEEPQTFLLEGADVRFNQNGVPQFLTVEGIPPDSILWWLSYDKGPYLLAAGESREVPISISIPGAADPGGHYGAILVSRFGSGDKNQSAAKLESKVGSLLFVNVEGKVYRSFSVASFSSEKGLYSSLPVSFNLLVKSEGNTHLQPYGTITIRNALTRKKVASFMVNEDFKYLFPGTARSLPVEWEARGFPPFWPLYFGKYEALLELKTAESPTATAEASFWIIPVKVVFVLLAIALAAFFGLRYYGRRLIKKAQDGS